MDSNNPDIEKIIESINNIKPFSGVVLVQKNGKVIFHKAYGFANRSEEIHNSVDTRFGIASGCKIFTAIAICQLIEKGLISFDTLLRDCLNVPSFEFNHNITIHHLLTHSSGIPDYFDEEIMTDYGALWNDIPMYRMKRPMDFIPMFEGKNMKFSPGDRFHYNNAGFVVLGLIVEQQTGLSFNDYIEKNIFLPCEMYNSGYFSLDELPKNVAYGYIENESDGTWKTNIYSIPIVGGPDGGAFVTASDMLKFWKGLFEFRLLNKNYTQKLTTDYIHAEEDEYYGYGIWINKRNNRIFKYHLMGGDPGVCFRSSVYPQYDMQSVVLGNKQHGAYAITKEIENWLQLSASGEK